MTRFVLSTLAFLVLAALGCGSSNVVPCLSGNETCGCYPNGTCNAGLSCEAEFCVSDPSGTRALPVVGGGVLGGAGVSAGSAARVATSLAGRSQSAGRSAALAAGKSGNAGQAAVTQAGSNAVLPDAGSDAECIPTQKSTPRSAADPCKQDNAACAAVGGVGIAPCGADARWGQCLCEISPASPVPPRKNGETCAIGRDCASGTCQRNQVGELHCYGTGAPNELCRDAFDCRGGLCVGRISDTVEPVCVDGIAACEALGLLGTCTEDLAIATCQLDELCDTPKSRLDFNSCVRYGCQYWHDNPPTDGCEAQLSFSRGGRDNCPKD